MFSSLGDRPRLTFGLWRYPLVSALVETALVIGGAYLCWRATTGEERAADGNESRAILLAGLIVVAGFVTLGFDLLAI